uniref:RING-type E3 ubiquitin transferase n=1 Tax=Kalanchoe fedtschenkoi TaxID=63787 RepID=A0A7N0ZSI7_KALFE
MAALTVDHQLPDGNYCFSVRQSQQSYLHPEVDEWIHTTVKMNLWKMSAGESGAYELVGIRECLVCEDEVAAEQQEELTSTLKTHLTRLGIVTEQDQLDAIHIVMGYMRTVDVFATAGMLVEMDIFEPYSYRNMQIGEEAGTTEVRAAPASEAAIAALDKVEVEEGACAICLEENKERFSRTPCKHVFHTKCVEKWLRISSSCPMCRYAMPVQK